MKKLLMATALISGMGLSGTAKAADLSRAEIENIVKEYIQNNPEAILDSVESYTREQQVAEMEKQQESIEKHLDWLENNEMLPVAGNPDGDVTVVEFFDYNCGYCKKAVDNVMTLMGEDDDVKFVFVEMPILGRTSEQAARWAMAAQKQDAYLDFHIGLMQNRGPVNEAAMVRVAKKIGLDVEQLKEDAASEEIAQRVAEKTSRAAQMGISGTPAFIIGGKLYGGYIELEMMRQAVKEARESDEENSNT